MRLTNWRPRWRRESRTGGRFEIAGKNKPAIPRRQNYANSVHDDSGTRKIKKFRACKKAVKHHAPVEIKESDPLLPSADEKDFIKKVHFLADKEAEEFNLDDVSIGSRMDETDAVEVVQNEEPKAKKQKVSKKANESIPAKE